MKNRQEIAEAVFNSLDSLAWHLWAVLTLLYEKVPADDGEAVLLNLRCFISDLLDEAL